MKRVGGEEKSFPTGRVMFFLERSFEVMLRL